MASTDTDSPNNFQTTLPAIHNDNFKHRQKDADEFKRMFNLDMPLENNYLIQYLREKNMQV